MTLTLSPPAGLRLPIPAISARTLGVFRVLIGLGFLAAFLINQKKLPNPFPREAHRPVSPLADFEWVHWLASTPNVREVVTLLTIIALILFIVGLWTRVVYALAVTGIVTHVLMWLLANGNHDWGLPVVTLIAWMVVPWGDGFSIDSLLRRRRNGRDVPRFGQAYGFAIWLPGLTIGLALLAGAVSKLRASGPAWITNGTVRYFFVEDVGSAPLDWGLRMATSYELSVLLSLGAILIEGLFFLVIFVRRPALRAAFALAALSMFAAFYLFQGMFWLPWWVLFAAFLPWQYLDRLTVPSLPSAPALNLNPAHAALALVLIGQQIFASALRIEMEPLLSDFPMYRSTESMDEFNTRLRFRMSDYSFVANDVDVTERLRSIPFAWGQLMSVMRARYETRADRPLPRTERTQLREIKEIYDGLNPEPLRRVIVLETRREFDWEQGKIVQFSEPSPFGSIDFEQGSMTLSPSVARDQRTDR